MLAEIKNKFKKGNDESEKKPKESKISKRKIKGERNLKLSKTMTQKIVSWTLLILIIASVFFNIVFFSKYNSISSNISAQQQQINEELNKVEDNKIYESDRVVFYGKEFLRDFINISESEEDRADDIQNLKKYFHNEFEINELYNVNDFNGSRHLTDIEYVERSIDKNKIIDLTFEVDYTVTSTTELTDEEKAQLKASIKKEVEDNDDVKKKDVDNEVEKRYANQVKPSSESYEHTTLITIPITAVEDSYILADKPREVSTELYASASEDEVNQRAYQGEELSQNQISDLDTTLNDFFVAYGKDDENIRLISNFESGLGQKELSQFNIREAYSFEENEQSKVTAIVDVNYQDEKTNLVSAHTYNVTLQYFDGRYIVDDIQ